MGEDEGKPIWIDVYMIDKEGKKLAQHEEDYADMLAEKRRKNFVTMENMNLRCCTESWPGKKDYLQDRFVEDKGLDDLGMMFGVFDGHNGHQVWDIITGKLHTHLLWEYKKLSVQPNSRNEKLVNAHIKWYEKMDEEICEMSERKGLQTIGSTSNTVTIHGNPKLGTGLRLVCSNIGDTRWILCRGGKAVSLSEDHKPGNLMEKNRIERAGGTVMDVKGKMRVIANQNPNARHKAGRKNWQGLEMTRSFGDLYFKTPLPLVLPTPDVKVQDLTSKDFFVVICSDGIFDVLSNQEVVDLAAKHYTDPEEASKNIVRTAFKKGTEDNITAQVVQFAWNDSIAEKMLKGGSAAAAAAGGIGFAGVNIQKDEDDMDMFG